MDASLGIPIADKTLIWVMDYQIQIGTATSCMLIWIRFSPGLIEGIFLK